MDAGPRRGGRGGIDLPREIPIFPLPGALLLPHGRLPLNIFEPRYLAMVDDSLGEGRLFGMIQPDPGVERGESGPGLFEIGCLGRISSFSETEDDRYLISVTGLIRFRVARELDMRRGYRRVATDYHAWLHDLDAPPETLPQRAKLLQSLRAYFAARGFDANWAAIDGMADSELVVTLAMVCPFEPNEKQALLEAADPAARADTLLALLEMGAHPGPDGGGRAS